ncbi:MAG: 2Fe-2S iron-sulfur cluster-binding protein [Spirulinaceae cyanobacterium]
MPVYQVRLVNQQLNIDQTIEVPSDQYIFDIADEFGITLPSGCLQGECSACLAKIVSGKVDQKEQNFLKPEEIQGGYTVTCVAYPQSNCVLETHQEQVLYKSSLYY